MLGLGKKYIFKVVTDIVLSQFKDTKKDVEKYVKQFVDERINDIKDELYQAALDQFKKKIDLVQDSAEKKLSLMEKQIDIKVEEILSKTLNEKKDKPKTKKKVGRPKKK